MRRRLGLALLALALLALVLLAWLAAGLPPRSAIRELASRNPGKTRLMLQREQEARARGRPARSAQSWVPLARVSRHLIHAVLAAEDQNFFGHEGVDWEAIQRSIEKDVEKRRFASGGSTITQQLAKNLFFGTSKTLTRKVRELIVARWLEADLSKARILALYLNVIEWGDGVYGCEAAARRWYGKPANELSAEEAAGLAAMIPNPRRLNPQVNPARHARATRRVLWLMAKAGYLGRDAAGLGAEPSPEPVPEEPEDESPLAAPAPESAGSAGPTTIPSPAAPAAAPAAEAPPPTPAATTPDPTREPIAPEPDPSEGGGPAPAAEAARGAGVPGRSEPARTPPVAPL
jgi:monofunctional biosynthetic peptidoglycan transglycosylase